MNEFKIHLTVIRTGKRETQIVEASNPKEAERKVRRNFEDEVLIRKIKLIKP